MQIEVLLLRVIFSSNKQHLLLSIPQICITYPWVVLYSTSTLRWAGSHPVTAIVNSLKFFAAQLRDHQFTVLMDHQRLLSFLRPQQTSQKLAYWQAYIREFDLVIEHIAGKENLLADALSRKYKYSLDPTEEQDFIPQSIDPTKDNSNVQDTSITINNLSISPIPQEITMVSRGCIKFKHMDCNYNKCAGRDESLGHHHCSPYLDDENDVDYEDYVRKLYICTGII